MEPQKTPLTKAVSRRKNKAGGIMLPDVKLYSKAVVIKTGWHWHKSRFLDRWNRIESPRINPCICCPFMAKEPRITIEKDVLVDKWCW